MQTVVMPKMGDTMEEGKILTWRKHEGDTVERGDALAEIETEKVNIEAESFAEGVLRKILVQQGQTVPVGTPIALVGAPNEAIPAEYQGGGDQPGAKQKAQQAAGSEAPESQPSRPVYAQGQAEVAPELTAPRIVDQPVTAGPAAAREAAASARAESRATMGAPVVAGSAPGPNGTAASLLAHASAPAHASATTEAGRIFISPIARRIAQEHSLDIAQISGTGPGGRIIKEDVEAALEAQQSRQPQRAQPTRPLQPTEAAPSTTAPAAQAAATTVEGAEAVPLTAMRRTIARRLQQSMQTAPHFYVTVAIDTTRLAELRATVNAYTERRAEPIKISYNDLIVKGVALALRRMPQVNVSFAEDAILFKKHVNIGVAVALEQGLIVPVIRDADRLSLGEIARESQRLSAAARAGTLKPEDFQGGTFTVSNLGMFGVEDFTAVINPPEAAILAVAAIVPTPVAQDGQVVVRDRMKVTLSVDHRAIDGATAARFLQALKQLLEEPMGLLV